MKHQHDGDINLNIPTQELEDLIDKATNAAVTIIAAVTAAQIIKTIFSRLP